jgi:hypothetical protein
MPRSSYAEHREAQAKRRREQVRDGQDVGPVPRPRLKARRARYERDLAGFCRFFLRETFVWPFCDDQLRVIGRMEEATLAGGRFALSMPRGGGKSALSRAAALKALLYGHRSFVVLIAAEQGMAERELESIKTTLETNDLLLAAFPEVCYPIRRLERSPHRCRGQRVGEVPTRIFWGSDRLTLPTVKGSRASGSVIRATGLESALRGMSHTRPDGTIIRPDLVIPDDPQTDSSARSASQTAFRERLLLGAVLGLAGPGKKIACVMPMTPIAPNDLADRFLSPAHHPDWNGERTKMLYGEPERKDLWGRYGELFDRGSGAAPATEFYRQNRAEMDRGLRAAWEQRHYPEELSAVQHAMNLLLTDPVAFAAEYQSDPQPLTHPSASELVADQVAARCNRHERGLCPAGATRLTAFIDVQQTLLWYAVCAWEEGFTGHVIDYGAFPDQRRPYYTLADANPTLTEATGIGSLEGSVWEGLDRLTKQLCGRAWAADGGGSLTLDRCLIDSGDQTELIYRFCRRSPHAVQLTASKGWGVSAASRPMNEWKRLPGQRHARGGEWVLQPASAGRPRLLIFDANLLKSFAAARLLQPPGERGALALWGDRPEAHRLLADHCTSEYAVRTEGRGRVVWAWQRRPHRPDNHLFDTLVGAVAGAMMEGVTLAGAGASRPPPRPQQQPAPKIPWSEVQRRKMAERAKGR